MAPRVEDLHWDDLRFFLRAVQAGTLAGAARNMGVEHTTVGRRLAALERSLGAALVLRGPDGLVPTALGERLLPLAEQVEQAVLATLQAARSQTARVRLSVPSGFTRLFADAMGTLREKQPHLTLELVSGARQVDLLKGEADLALRTAPVREPQLVARKLATLGWSLYASEGYLARRPFLDLTELGAHELIGFDDSLSKVAGARWLNEHAGSARVVLRSREMTDMLSAALAGVGLAMLPCVLADAEPALRRLTPDILASQGISLVYMREARLSQEVRAVIELVLDVMKRHGPLVAGARRPTS